METESSPLITYAEALTNRDKFGYSLGHIQNDLFAAMWFSYALIFFQLATAPNTILSGWFILIGQLTDAFATPLAGYMLDDTENKRKMHICGALVTSLSFPLMFTLCLLCMNESIWISLYYSPSIIIFQCGWAFVQISHLSILPEMTKNHKERAELTSYRYSASMIANIILYIITWCFFANSTSNETTLLGPDDSSRFLNVALTSTFIGLCSTGIFHVLTKQKSAQTEKLQIEDNCSNGINTTFRKICCSSDIYVIAGIYTSSRLFLNITMGYMQLYINDNVISYKESIAIIPLTMFISSAITSMFYKHFFTNIGGHKFIYIIAWITSVCGCAIIYNRSESSDSITDILISAALFGIGSALALVVSLSLAANLVQKKGTEGFIYSSVTFTDKVVNGVMVVIIEYLKCTEKELCSLYYRNVLVFVNGALISFGLFFIFCLPKNITKLN